jgi:hypothetical protein
MNRDLISIKEACKLLDVSRPTFNKYRDDYSFEEFSFRGRIFFSKIELIEKIILNSFTRKNIDLAFTAMNSNSIEQLFILDDIADLRGNIKLDAFGIISLLCMLKNKIKNQDQKIYLLIDDTPFCKHLSAVGFFRELERSSIGNIIYNKKLPENENLSGIETILFPLHLIGYRGAEKKVIETLYAALVKQGFSENLSGYLGWVIGELSDNCHTHSKSGPCYLMIESTYSENISSKFLSVVIGDIGVGIHNSLRANTKYAYLSESEAFVTAFKSDVSSWPDEHKRGKGLNDILAIGIGNNAWIRAESCGIGFFANFSKDNNHFELIKGCTYAQGTRVGLILIDNTFKDIPRSEVNATLDNFIKDSTQNE